MRRGSFDWIVLIMKVYFSWRQVSEESRAWRFPLNDMHIEIRHRPRDRTLKHSRGCAPVLRCHACPGASCASWRAARPRESLRTGPAGLCGNNSSRQPRAEVCSIQRVKRRFSRHRRMGASVLRGADRADDGRRGAERRRDRSRLSAMIFQSAMPRRARDHQRRNI